MRHLRSLLPWAATAAFLLPVMFGLGALTVSDADPSRTVIVDGSGWRCSGPIDLDLVRVTNPPGDGVTLAAGCTGRVGRLEVSGVRNGDGIKVQNASSNAARDLTVGGGFVSCAGPPTDGTHQDGIQAMGGRNIVFQRLVIDCYGGGGGNLFIKRGGGGATTPTGVVCEGCAIGPRHPNSVRIEASVASGLRDSLVCQSPSGRRPIVVTAEAVSPVNERNTVAPQGDPRCTWEGLLAYVGGAASPPEPPPPTTEPPPPEPPPPACDQACVDSYEQQLAGLRAQLDTVTAERDQALAEVARLGGIIDRAMEQLAAK